MLMQVHQGLQVNAAPTALEFMVFGASFLVGLWLTNKFLVSISDEGFFTKLLFGMAGIFADLVLSIMVGFTFGSPWVLVGTLVMAGLVSLMIFFSKDRDKSRVKA